MADTDNKKRRYKVTVDGQELGAGAEPADSAPLDGQITMEGFEMAAQQAQETIIQDPTMQALREWAKRLAAEIQEIKENTPEIRALLPLLAAELEAAQQEGLYPGVTLQDLIAIAFYSDGTPREGEYFSLIQKVGEKLPRVMAIPGSKLPMPLDKPNADIWKGGNGEELEGGISYNVAPKADRAKGKEASINLRILFDVVDTPGSGVTITKQLTPFDKRVYLATASLWDAGNRIISTTQIYSMMGYRGKPSSEHTQQINASLSKMTLARLYVDNLQESSVYRGYSAFTYDASLLPFERISAYINGQITESSIHLFTEPPLITFAKTRKQITTIPKQLLETPVSKTNTNLYFEDYLLRQISHMKNNKHFSRKMLYSSIFNACRITTKKQKQRAPGTIKKILDYYAEQQFIAGYTETKEGITIRL